MVTFPTEAKFAEADFARQTYRSVIRRTLDAGVSPSFPLQLAELQVLPRQPPVAIMGLCTWRLRRYSPTPFTLSVSVPSLA
jgi:hypothetical protein